MPLPYNETFKVYQFECDPWNRMTPGAILRRAQEISTAQCESLNMNDELYQRTNTVFLLSRLSLKINKPFLSGDSVRIETRPYAMHRAIYQRVTTFFNEAGEAFCETDSRWVLVSTLTRRILRREPEGFVSPYMDLPGAEGHNFDYPAHGPLAMAAQGTAAYSFCDINGHLNNTRYADIVCDALPLHQLQKGLPHKMLLFYRSEISLGEEYQLLSAPAGDGGIFLEGNCKDSRRFEAYVEW